jgi:uncharacterized damage-inducible protein DinB
MLKSFSDEYERYKIVGRKAIDQVSDEALNEVAGADGNSIAVIVRHISGNLVSRFTDFLTTDGEKPWRDRDSEFEDTRPARDEIIEMWDRGWRVLESQLSTLSDSDLDRRVEIRGQSLTVHEALSRSLAHAAYHIGQIVLLARILKEGDWQWLSIPRGKSKEYNQNPTMEKKPQQ